MRRTLRGGAAALVAAFVVVGLTSAGTVVQASPARAAGDASTTSGAAAAALEFAFVEDLTVGGLPYPMGVAVDPGTGRLVIAAGDAVGLVDPDDPDGAVVAGPELGTVMAEGLAGVTVLGDHAYLSDPATGGLVSVDVTAQNSGELLPEALLESSDDAPEVPYGIGAGPNGDLYVVDQTRRRVLELDGETTVRWWGGYSPTLTAGQFVAPSALAVGADGAVYVADPGTRSVHRFEADGTGGVVLAGSAAFSGLPAGLAAAGSRLYVSDSSGSGSTVRVLDAATGAQVGIIDDPARLIDPAGLAVADNGYVYVADPSTSSVHVYRPVLAALTAPAVRGSATFGSTLRAVPGTWTVPGVTFAYQWRRDGAAISGATAATHRVVAADAGRKLTVRVTASRPGYPSASATSSARAVARLASTTRLTLRLTSVNRVTTAMAVVRVTAEGGVAPTGRVRIKEGKATLAVVDLSAAQRGKVAAPVGRLRSGKHALRAVYVGSTQVAPSASALLTFRVRAS